MSENVRVVLRCLRPPAAVLDRDVLVSRERERKLQNDLEVVTARLLHQEQMNVELRMKHNQLISRSLQQQVPLRVLICSSYRNRSSCKSSQKCTTTTRRQPVNTDTTPGFSWILLSVSCLRDK